MKRLLPLALLLACPLLHAQCPATDSFSGSGALNSANWTQIASGAGISTLNQVSGTAQAATASTQGYAVWSQTSCSPAASQAISTSGSTLVAGSGSTGLGVNGDSSGDGYVWLANANAIYKITALGGVGAVASGCPTVTSGHTYTLVSTVSGSSNTPTLYDNGSVGCSGTDSSSAYTTGKPFILVDDRSSSSNAIGPVTIDNAPLVAPTFSPNGGTFTFTLTVTLTPPSGATACYTTDGSTPTAPTAGTCSGGTTQTYSTPISVSSTTTIKAVSTKSGSTNSFASSATFTIRSPITWFVREDGGTRYQATDAPMGQCNGQADAAYPGSGTNQACAFSSVQYMWMDGAYGNSAWVIAGGDKVVIRGCAAFAGEQNSDPPHCRVGWTTSTGGGICQGVTAFWGCSMPPPPNGSSSQHTQILGACAYGTYTCNPVSGYPYTSNNLTQLFGGFNVDVVMYLNGSQYVDIEGLEITTHNGACTTLGSPEWPAVCSASSPVSDFANQGIAVFNTTSNILLQDVYIHGFTNNGIGGSIGGPFTLTRVSIDFNAFAGWNFDDASHDPDVSSATLTQSYVSMVGNGCLEQYPIVNTQFPAKSCWDSDSAGFGDSWSGQATDLNTFTCDHCYIAYNTKDGGIGPHTDLLNLSLTNSVWIGNMGQQWKWGMQPNSTTLFQNNLIMGNCNRMSEQLIGAAQNFNSSTGLNGSYLSLYCRAAGTMADYFADVNSSVLIANNTFVTYSPTVFDFGCGTENMCNPYVLKNDVVLGYTNPQMPDPSGEAPGLYYLEAGATTTATYMVEYGTRNDDCGTPPTGVQCTSPLFLNQPSQTWVDETSMDCFNVSSTSCFYLASNSSPPHNAGTTYSGQPTTFQNGAAQTSPLTIGALGVYTSPIPAVSISGSVSLKGVLIQ